MTRRQEIESIIIGTILSSHLGENYLNDCKSCITADMFSDEKNAKIYSTALEMQKAGCETITPTDVVEYKSDMISLAPYMCELADDWFFEAKKAKYNSNVYYSDTTGKSKYTHVTFSDYVNRFVQLVFSS